VENCVVFDKGEIMSQQILFAPSVASVSGANQWSMVSQGRIFEPAEGRIQSLIDDIVAPLVGASRTDPLFRARVGYFVSDSIPGVCPSITLGDQVVQLASSNPAGYFVEPDIPLTNDQVTRLSRDGVITFESQSAPNSPARFPGSAMLVPEEGVIVVSDIDDTIKDTKVTVHHEAIANTLVRPFRPVDGMPDVYRAWKEASGSRIHFHIVSAGPWHFHEPLRRFTEEAGFPAFTWDMRSLDLADPKALIAETVKPNPDRLKDFKLKKISDLMKRFPRRHVVLVGDSGEKDPETYAAILSDSEFADRVDAVFIHNVTEEGKDFKRYQDLFPTPKAAGKLQVFAQASELPLRL
jgi:phosphatidate phosphatase APP1